MGSTAPVEWTLNDKGERVAVRGTRWVARWRDPDNKSCEKRFATKAAAENHVTAMESALLIGTYVDPRAGQVTFAAFANEWAAGRDWKDETTRQDWVYVSKRLASRIGSRRIGRIDRLALDRLQVDLGDEYARATVELTMSYAKAVMKAAYTSGRIGRDPTVGMSKPTRRAGDTSGKVGPDDVPTRDEVVAMITAAPAAFRAAIALGATGLRIGEVLGLTADRVDLEAGTVLVDRQLQRRQGAGPVHTGPKREKERTVHLPEVAAGELRRHLAEQRADGILFRGGRTTEDRGLYRTQFYAQAWAPTLRAAGIAEDRYHFHSLRHFAASAMLAAGAPITAVAAHLGDTVETVQRTYAHWLRGDEAIPAAVLDKVLAGSDPSSVADVPLGPG